MVDELSVTLGSDTLPLMPITAEPRGPTLYDVGAGAMATTMYFSGWITLVSRVLTVMVVEVDPALNVATGCTAL